MAAAPEAGATVEQSSPAASGVPAHGSKQQAVAAAKPGSGPKKAAKLQARAAQRSLGDQRQQPAKRLHTT
jgi:hypothetical protein